MTRECHVRFWERVGVRSPRATRQTYIKVRGRWMYLYRAIDSVGDTVEFWFSEHRDLPAAKRFFRKALERHGRPDRIVIDGSQTNHEAIASCDAANRLQDRSRRRLKPITIRKSRYLNNRIEQDHRRIKRRVRPMLGLQVADHRQHHPVRHRNGPHDAKATGEVRLQSEPIPGRAVRHSGGMTAPGHRPTFTTQKKLCNTSKIRKLAAKIWVCVPMRADIAAHTLTSCNESNSLIQRGD
jgi:DDE domain